MQTSYPRRPSFGWLNEYRSEYMLVILTGVAFALAPLFTDFFLTFDNLFNLSRQGAYLGIVAIGMGLVLIVGGIDLSIGAVMQLVGLCTILLLSAGVSAALAFLVALLLGATLGAVNGLLTVYGRLQPFIATLATGGIMTGIVMTYTDGNAVAPRDIDPAFKLIGNGSIAGLLPIPALAMGFVLVLFWWLTTCTTYGRHLYATGANKRAARNVGVSVKWAECSVYIVSGTLAALAGYLTFARSGTFQPATAATGGTPVEVVIYAIAAVVLGGGSLVGGKGTVIGAALGALVSAVMLNLLILLGIGVWFQRFLLAIIIIVVVILARDAKRT